MSHYIKKEDNKIIMFWEDPISKGWTEEQIQNDIINIGGVLVDKNIVCGYDGNLYFEGEEPKISEEERIKQQMLAIDKQVQTMLDDFARKRDFLDIVSAATYVNSKQAKFAKNAQICLDVRDATWFALYTIRDKFLKGEIVEPSVEEIFANLPSMDWEYYDEREQSAAVAN